MRNDSTFDDARFQQLIDRRGTESIKWNYFDEDVLPMWVADMDFLCPPQVIEALQNRIEHGIFGYPTEPPRMRTIGPSNQSGSPSSPMFSPAFIWLLMRSRGQATAFYLHHPSTSRCCLCPET
jgi:hypothetical protein